MKISKIEAQVKNKARYSIFVDDKFAFGLSELGLINLGLRVGQELDASMLEDLKTAAKTDKIYSQALALIMRRPRSRYEIEDNLRRKSVDDVVASEIIDKLTNKGYINDEDFARRWVENRRLLKSISRRKLELELRQKRVSDSIIKAVMASDDTDELDVLMTEVEKKRRISRYKDDDIKLMQYLARQGYSYSDIKKALSGDTD